MGKRISRIVSIVVLLALISTAALVSAAQPRWAELATYQCALANKSGLFSNANVAATASTHSASSKLELTLIIQLWNGNEYTDTGNTWSASGTGATSIERNISLGLGNYRAKAIVKIYDATGAYIETVTRYSDSIII